MIALKPVPGKLYSFRHPQWNLSGKKSMCRMVGMHVVFPKMHHLGRTLAFAVVAKETNDLNSINRWSPTVEWFGLKALEDLEEIQPHDLLLCIGWKLKTPLFDLMLKDGPR